MKKYSLSKLSGKLKRQRRAKGLSRDALAARARVNYNTIIKLESGANKNPTIKTLLGLASALKLEVEDLIS